MKQLMRRFQDVVSLQTRAGEPVAVSGVIVTPYSQALTVRLPWGAFVWNRPVSVVVEHEGWIERIPIFDLTRLIQLSLLGFGLAMALMAVYRHLGAAASNLFRCPPTEGSGEGQASRGYSDSP